MKTGPEKPIRNLRKKTSELADKKTSKIGLGFLAAHFNDPNALDRPSTLTFLTRAIDVFVEFTPVHFEPRLLVISLKI